MKSIRLRARVLAALFILAGLAGCTRYAPAPDALTVPANVEIRQSGRLLLIVPRGGAARTGLVFYPGGLVDHRAYVPLAARIAGAGHPVAIVRMPLDLAVLGKRRGLAAAQALPSVGRWAIGGHSLGGAMAAGLVLLAAYPPDGASIAGTGLPALSIVGTRDRVVNPEKLASAPSLLPPEARFVRIEGGNHAQFGDYGPQKGDGAPGITREEQLAVAGTEIARFLDALDAP